MKNILICLEKLDIGGVETFCISQAIKLKKMGYNPILICQKGELYSCLEKEKIKVIDYKFDLCNRMVVEEKLESIIKENRIDFIYINQNPCMLYILPIAIKNKIPYIVYIHSIVDGTFEWFMDHYPVYNFVFPICLGGASKIITITKKIKDDNSKLFGIEKNKYQVINNSLDFDLYPNTEIKNIKKDKLVWFGRMSEEKEKSIIAAISFFEEYSKVNKEATLTFIGDGNIKNMLVEKYSSNNRIIFKPSSSNIANDIKKYDVVIAVDRCAMEGVASKKITLISSYEGKVIFVDKNNIKRLINNNMSGFGEEQQFDKFNKLNDKQMINNINDTYNYLYINNNLKDSIYSDFNEKNEMISYLEFRRIVDITNRYDDYINRILEQLTKTTSDYNNLLKEYQKANEFLIQVTEKKNFPRRVISKIKSIIYKLFKKR